MEANLKADAVQQVFVVRDVRVLLGYLTARGQEHSIRHFPANAIRATLKALHD